MDVKASYMFVTGTVVVSLGIGAFAGYLFAKKQLEIEYSDLAQKEILEAKHFYNALHKRGKFASPESVVKVRVPNEDVAEKTIRESTETMREVRASRAARDYRGESVVVRDQTPGAVTTGNPSLLDGNFDYEEELLGRSPEHPYVISKEEFDENEGEFDDIEVMYYLGDDVVTDETGKSPMDQSDEILGDDNLLRFGDGSGDPYIVYIRNDKFENDYCVVKNLGSFEEKVLGFKHSDTRRHNKKTKFRAGDDD